MIVLGEFGDNRPQLVSRHGEIAGVAVEVNVQEKPCVEITVDQIQQVISLRSADDDLGDVVGEQDAITPPEMAERMGREIPDSEVVRIKGAGHMAIMEQPE